ncbi:GAF domain-containing sensor histidine kinase [Neobacillus sp. D3-1R]|uniref:GAF domain-containing sensor histidine kinase n=1 Tax=Neobacillus sp. D3-1R TaxID=3445778 RepID=UPI003FA0DAE0
MPNTAIIQKKERRARINIFVISLIGWVLIFTYGFMGLQEPRNVGILILLFLFLVTVEFFPIPVWRGFTSIAFPIVYAILVMQGISFAITAYSLVVFGGYLLKRRPLRIVFFNPAQLAISFLGAYWLAEAFLPFFKEFNESRIILGIIHFSLMIVPFYFFNNLIVDYILFLRPQTYTFAAWKQKTLQELNSLVISYIYLVLFIVLGNQNRGEIDFVAFFFFFSPLVGLALLSSSIVKLRKEKARLKALFEMSSELNKIMPSKEWLHFLQNSLQEFIDVDASILWICEDGEWKRKFSMGSTKGQNPLSQSAIEAFEQMKQITIYHDTRKNPGPCADSFDKEIVASLYAPLLFEDEIVGMFVFGRSRTRSFNEEDIQSGATLANQLAIVIKTKMLFSEQEKRLILEERNRIARDIHDGVAQSLAGAVMKLETAERKFFKTPEDSLKLMQESNEKLRKSLKEVRESIYALRPYPTERIGLMSAIHSRIALIQKENNVAIYLERRGVEYSLSSMVEKVIFDIFQESVQNAIKHAKATTIDILISYQSEHIFLKIKDNGLGFSLFQAMIKARNEPHFGILQMNESAERIHASLQIDSKEGEGTEISLTVPRMGIEGGMESDQAYASR